MGERNIGRETGVVEREREKKKIKRETGAGEKEDREKIVGDKQREKKIERKAEWERGR